MPFKTDRVKNLSAAPTASDVIYRYVRDAIIDGSLDEGESIRQDEVARLFGVSKIPVREALKRLEAEGFVGFQRNRGATVTPLSKVEIKQIFEVRAILESNAIQFSVPHMTGETFARAEIFREAFAEERDVARWSKLNWQFHSCLYEDANRPYLFDLIRSANDRLERYLRLQLSLSRGQETADLEHRQILAVCRKGDQEGAAKLVKEHVLHACDSLMQQLPFP